MQGRCLERTLGMGATYASLDAMLQKSSQCAKYQVRDVSCSF